MRRFASLSLLRRSASRRLRVAALAALAAIALVAGSAVPAPAPVPAPIPPQPGPLAPTLIAVSPSSGPVGTPVTISGTNLTATTQVTVSCNLPNLPAPFTVVSDTVIHATVPVGAKLGVCGVTVASPNGGAGIGGVVTPPQPGSFTVTAGAP